MNLPSKKRIGVLGGGQLGKMLIEASRPWNVDYVVLENDANCPASKVADHIVVGSLFDGDKIRELAEKTDILTYEIEHVNVEVLKELQATGMKIYPQPEILEMIQDKGLQKNYFTEKQLPTAEYVLVNKGDSFLPALSKLKGDTIVLKHRKGGYDGKGVEITLRSNLELMKAETDCLLEEFHSDMTEYAVIVSRSAAGKTKTFPLIEMYFHPVSNLVEFLFSPAGLDKNTEAKCKEIALNAIEKMDGIGVFAVELFVSNFDKKVFINEIAPRPHNSGHHTIEGCYTSQFEQLNRILLGLPLGDTELIQPSAMINLVGPEGLTGNYQLDGTDKILAMGGVYIHLYNKKDIKPNRKMGHITVLAPTLEELKMKAEEVKSLISFLPQN